MGDMETASYPDSVSSSPRFSEHDSTGGGGGSRVRFMCSYGGQILPRPHDNQLRYVGGDTRIVAVSRNVTYQVLIQKLSKLCGGSVCVKYQLPNEDLDALISVTTDEDLDNMMDEYDRLQSNDKPSSRLRLFLFPTKPQLPQPSLGSLIDPNKREHWFVDALNAGAGGAGAPFLSSNRSEVSSVASEIPDYLFGLDDTPHHVEVSSSPFCSASSVPDLPPIKVKREEPESQSSQQPLPTEAGIRTHDPQIPTNEEFHQRQLQYTKEFRREDSASSLSSLKRDNSGSQLSSCADDSRTTTTRASDVAATEEMTKPTEQYVAQPHPYASTQYVQGGGYWAAETMPSSYYVTDHTGQVCLVSPAQSMVPTMYASNVSMSMTRPPVFPAGAHVVQVTGSGPHYHQQQQYIPRQQQQQQQAYRGIPGTTMMRQAQPVGPPAGIHQQPAQQHYSVMAPGGVGDHLVQYGHGYSQKAAVYEGGVVGNNSGAAGQSFHANQKMPAQYVGLSEPPNPNPNANPGVSANAVETNIPEIPKLGRVSQSF